MHDNPGEKKLTLPQWLLEDLPSKGPPAWLPTDDPFPSLTDLLFSDSRDKVIAWYIRNGPRAIEELCDPVGHINRIKFDALRRGQKESAIKRWLMPRVAVLLNEIVEINDRFPMLSKDWVEAMRVNGQKWAALRVPENLTGHFKRKKIPDSELPGLLRKYEKFMERAAPTKGKLVKLLDEFSDLPPEISDITGRFHREKFAKAALAYEYECPVGTIEKALTRCFAIRVRG